jgi:hypothetical protein
MMINIPFNLLALDACQKGHDFLGLIPWYHYLSTPDKLDPRTCEIKHFEVLGSNSDIPLVLLAIVDDLLRIAALVAIGFVIAGAIRLITSQGNPEDTGKAQNTIVNALVGLAIAIIAAAFVSFLGHKLG